MEKEFVPFELAVKLKELEFDALCLASYSPGGAWSLIDPKSNEFMVAEIAAPLWQQAFDWFREKHNVLSWIDEAAGTFRYNIQVIDKNQIIGLSGWGCYFKCRSACLEKLIELVK